MNKVVLSGRLVKDAELGMIPSIGTSKMTYCIAVERAYQKDKNNKKSDFINCEMIGNHTEKLYQYLTKGKLIIVEGELNIDNYEKDGEKRSFTKVKVDRLEFLPTGKQDNNNSNAKSFQEIDTDDIPF